MSEMKFSRLLAKSLPSGFDRETDEIDLYTLPTHLADVCSASEQLVDSTGEAQLTALGLSANKWLGRMQQLVQFVAAIHDLGKANNHFQRMIWRKPGWRERRQGIRHEWGTLLLMQQREIAEWLQPALNDDDLRIARWAVTGHHPAYNRASPPRNAVDGGGSEVRLLLDHQDFRVCLKWLGERFELGESPTFPSPMDRRLVGASNVFQEILSVHIDDSRIWDLWQREDAELVRFVAAVKNCLVAADVAGSALRREAATESERLGWIPAVFARSPSPEQLHEVITDKLTDQKTKTVHHLRPFQEAVAELAGDVTFVKAGCGTGKTLAAYHWARTKCPNRRLYLCYPTTGTATEGFRDYLVSGESPRFHADLFHGRASIDLDILGVVTDSDGNEVAVRIDALDSWDTPIVCCTVDTVLGLVQNNRRGLFSWPALAKAAFVFDEIHAYDDRLYGALLRFLQAMPGLPTLLMTASLPARRRLSLEAALRKRGPAGTELVEVPGPEDLETRARYHLQNMENEQNLLATVEREFKKHGKILWVCNTVDRAIDASERVREMGMQPLIYHSRFRYVDRVERHKAVIDAFQTNGPALAICTQVAEMSLDLSATLLVTDLAPVPAIIQRLGRLNRRAEQGDHTRPFFVVEPERDGKPFCLPYSPEDFDGAKRWLNAVLETSGGKISQRHLSDAWEADDEAAQRKPAYVASAWLDGGPVSQVLELREASPGITVVRQSDVASLMYRTATVPEVALPMPQPPKHLKDRIVERFNGVAIAPDDTIDYDTHRGARWRRDNQAK